MLKRLSNAEKARLADVRDLLRRSRQRTKGISRKVIERVIRAAIATVRGKR